VTDHRSGCGRLRPEVVLDLPHRAPVVNGPQGAAHHTQAGWENAGGSQTGDVL
jgi:hypothetical protein